MNTLEMIVAHKREEVKQLKSRFPVSQIKTYPLYNNTCISLRQSLTVGKNTGIIAEFKRQSPSKGVINNYADVVAVTEAYAKAGAAGLSVLTDRRFFGGRRDDLEKARVHPIPILRKDFIIDAYQITESKAIGADVILLIAACLSKAAVQELAGYAKTLGLEVLLELHEEAELDHICAEVDIVGINNRNLKTFAVDVDTSVRMAPLVPADKVKISESGIAAAETIHQLRQHGYQGFLIGENFMKAHDPAVAFQEFAMELRNSRP